jgi:hypothetical protein
MISISIEFIMLCIFTDDESIDGDSGESNDAKTLRTFPTCCEDRHLPLLEASAGRH